MLTAAEQMSVKQHLGYSTVAPSLYPLAQVWLVAGQILSTLPAETESAVRTILGTLTTLEAQINDAPGRLQAEKLGSITLRADELDRLWQQRRRWQRELSVLTGLPDLRNRPMMVV